MFVKKKDEEVKAFLGAGAEFSGKLVLSGSVRIDGNFAGEISGQGTLIVGEKARVEADITVDSLFVFGEVRGTIETAKKLEINSSGRLFGKVSTASLVIEEGAIFEGECAMPRGSNGGQKGE